MQLRIFYFMQR